MNELPTPQLGEPGYEGYLNFNIASLGDLLSDAGTTLFCQANGI